MSKPGNPRLRAAVKQALMGVSTVDLRDLSPNRTLVLVNGVRLAAGEPLPEGVLTDVGDYPAPQPPDAA